MPEPVSASVVAVEIAKQSATLAKLGYDAWKSKHEAKEQLIGILTYVQDELNRNYKSLQDALNGSVDEQLEMAAYRAAIVALGHALKDFPSVLDPLRRAYEVITPGMQTRLKRPAQDEGDVADLTQLWSLVGQASSEIDRWFMHEGVIPKKPSKEECTYRKLGELIGGWPPSEQLRIARKRRDFVDALRGGKVRRYTLDEVGAVTMYAEPYREIEFRERAQSEWGWLHCFELVEGIHELWIEPAVRLLFFSAQWDPVVLDVVRLTGRDQDGWTPKWYVERARWRAEDWRRRAS